MIKIFNTAFNRPSMRRVGRSLSCATFALAYGVPLAALGQTNTFPASGNVGIGTTSPGALLTINGGESEPGFLTTQSTSGQAAGIFSHSDGGTFSMSLIVQNNSASGDVAAGVLRLSTAQTGNPNLMLLQAVNGTGASISFLNGSGGAYFASNVGIGTTNPQHLLHVAGTIGAEEVIVSSTGADYVFQSGYRLRPLSEVNAFIQENHHLPDIPSEAEVKENGVRLGEMQSKLLAKVEELTLHMIDADARNARLERENQELRALNAQTRNSIEHLEKVVRSLASAGGRK
jgi:hypothetical protein